MSKCVELSSKDAGWLHDYLRASKERMNSSQKKKTDRILSALLDAGAESSIYNHVETAEYPIIKGKK